MATTRQPQTETQIPLIVIIGATGTGKSKLAVDIARHLCQSMPPSKQNGTRLAAEIINADAMQLYDGLPIITNKLSVAEQEGIPHHLLGEIGLREETWNITQFLKEAEKRIDLIRQNSRIPIVVGGSGYYVHGLLLQDSTLQSEMSASEELQAHAGGGDEVADKDSFAEDLTGVDGNFDAEEVDRILQGTNAELLAKLDEVDPEMARKWHPNDRRKIQRSLEIWLKTGKKASEVYEAQNANRKALAEISRNIKDGPAAQLRYKPLIFWLEADDMVLKERLNKRVDTMVEAGLFEEARAMAAFEKQMMVQGTPVEKDRGIWASIGYKEVEPWLQHSENPVLLDDEKMSRKLRESCIEAVKAGTRQYAKRQNRYVRIRLANALSEAGLRHQLFLLDGSDLSKWKKIVELPATWLVDQFLGGKPLPDPAGLSGLASTTFAAMDRDRSSSERHARHCETCDKVLMTEKEWSNHVNSRSHKKALQGVKRREMLRERAQSAIAKGAS